MVSITFSPPSVTRERELPFSERSRVLFDNGDKAVAQCTIMLLFFFSPTVLVFVSLLIKCSTVISCVTFPGTIDLAVSLNYLILVPVFYTRLVVYMLACM